MSNELFLLSEFNGLC